MPDELNVRAGHRVAPPSGLADRRAWDRARRSACRTRSTTLPWLAGVKIITYEVTFTNGVRTSRKLVGKVVAKAPVTRVIVVGTKEPLCPISVFHDHPGCPYRCWARSVARRSMRSYGMGLSSGNLTVPLPAR